MNNIKVFLNLSSPLHVAIPADDTKSDAGSGKGKISRTAKMPIVTSDGKLVYVPIYPANGFRGGLRRKAMSRILDILKASDTRISKELYLGLSCGASSANPENQSCIQEIVLAHKNVYMGLFGGGMRMLRSGFRVSDMIPIVKEAVEAKLIPEGHIDVRSNLEGKSLNGSGIRSFVRVDDLFRVSRATEINDTIKDALEVVSEHQNLINVNNSERKKQKQSKEDKDKLKKIDVANLQSFEYVPAGTPFYFEISLDKEISEAQLGLMLLSLSDLFEENAFGGWVRTGFGKVNVEHISIEYNGERFSADEPYEDGIFTLPSSVNPYIDAANEAIKAIDVDELENYFAERPSSKKEKKADKKPAAAEA